jgi:MFS family permease
MSDSKISANESTVVTPGLVRRRRGLTQRDIRRKAIRAYRMALTLKAGKALAAVIIGTLVLRLGAQTMSQMLQFYFARIDQDYYGLSNTITGLVTAAFFVTELLGSPIFGAMSDRLGRKKFILLGPIFGAVAVQITAMTMAVWLLVITRLLAGLSTASSVPSTLGFISDATTNRPNLRARIMGLFEITFIGGVAIGAIAGGYLWKYFGQTVVIGGIKLLSPAFSLNGAIYMISFAIFWWGLRAIPSAPSIDESQVAPADENLRPGETVAAISHTRIRVQKYLAILKSKPVVDFAPAWLAVNSIIGMWINNSTRLFTENERHKGQVLMGHFGPLRFGYGLAAILVIFALGVLVWSFFIGRYRKTGVMLVATTGLFLTLLLLYFFNHGAQFSEATNHLIIAGLIFGLLIMSGFTPAALTYLADISEAFASDRGSIMGMYTVFLGLGQVIGTTVGGFFATWRGIDGLIFLSLMLGTVTVVSLTYLRAQETLEGARYTEPVPGPFSAE